MILTIDGVAGAGKTTLARYMQSEYEDRMSVYIELTKYDWINDRAGPTFTVPPVELLIIEGVGSGQSSIREFVETKIWIDLEPIGGLRRVLARDGFEIEEQMRRFLQQQEIHFVQEGTRAAADFHLNGLH